MIVLHSIVRKTTIAASLAVAASALTACGGSGPGAGPARAGASDAPAAPAAAASQAGEHDDHALHNVHHVSEHLISGAVPEGDAGFDELAALGVKTVISVDGAAPDLERAKARGMRYVHIPITYAEVTPEQQLAIARAIRDLPGPVYIHCHHGKHRGPAAAAAAAVNLGLVSPAEAVAFMKTAGTADSYAGLYACVMEADAATKTELDAAPSDFPEHQRAEGIVAAMVEIEQAFDHLGDIRFAGWTVPPDHPDLVPAAEAGRLTDNFRFAAEDERAQEMGEDHIRRLFEAVKVASALEEGIIAGESAETLNAHYKLIDASCKGCHAEYRNKRR